MKLIPRFIAVWAVILTASVVSAPTVLAQDLSAAAYIVIDHHSGHVLDGLNTQKKLPIASLTKIATATVVLDWANASSQSLDQLATVPPLPTDPTSAQGLGLSSGDKATLRDLLYAALLQSDNTAASTLADFVGRALGGNPDNSPTVTFVSQMNALGRKLGMVNTQFLNPHGLDNLERRLPYSTAEDIAKLTAYAMSNSAFRFLVSQKERRVTVQKADGTKFEYRLKNTNELLGKDAIDGVKTGTTKKAGQCLVISSARAPESIKDGETYYITPRRLEVVVLGSDDRFNEAATLLKRGWALHEDWVSRGRPEPVKGNK